MNGIASRRIALGLLLAGATLASAAAATPSFENVQRSFRSSEAMLLDRHGAPLQQLRINPAERRLAWVRLEDVSPAVRDALIASEDQRFYAHSGVDWSAVAGAAWGNLWHRKTRGASTVTMQLAGLLDDDAQRPKGGRGIGAKFSQVMVAQSLERSWRKDQILEAYLNLVSFRGELVGIDALARVLFGKAPSGLDQREAAIAVALIRAPNAPPSRVAERACAIVKARADAAACSGLADVTEVALGRPLSRADSVGASSAPQLAPHLARRLLKTGGLPVRSTLDAGTQRFVHDALTRQLAALAGRNIEDGAVLVLDNLSGDVLAWVGSSGALSQAGQVDGVLALRQAGSTLKPFLYELAIEHRWMTAASIIDDAPINLATGAGLYLPQNYDNHFKGPVSLRTALGSSLNVPAVRTLVTVTPERFFQRLQAVGFRLRESGDYYGYSLALGSADVSLLELTNAYRALANRGRFAPVRTTLADRVAPPTAAMDPAATFIVGDILADRSARARTFGLENALSTRIWTAVKTGTSKDMRDNWCIGFSDRFTVGVWVGNASGAPMWDVSGVTGAAPVWQEVMQTLHAENRQRQVIPAPPTDVVTRSIRYEGELEAARTEYFLQGTEQSLLRTAHVGSAGTGIDYPTSGMLVALDPDIPPASQRLRFAARGKAAARWRLDGKLLSAAHAKGSSNALALDWMPWPGRHTLELLDRRGAVLDQIQFEVRGAVLRPLALTGQKRPSR